MSFFQKKDEASSGDSQGLDGISLLEKNENGLIDGDAFITAFAEVKVFYSTPFGDHKDGGSRLFLLPGKDGAAYMPVFISEQRIKEFYEKAGRLGFLVMENSFRSVLETTRKINSGNTPVKMGVVIEPGYYGVTIDANMLDAALDLAK
ncbi:MAG: SseB family protein [Lachnospiraceae bacterium]|nr:SseB family protein [Lachnospiraceae bacterium]